MDVSVFITSYNQKAYLQEAIDSVLAQTLPPAQIIIVDDCSSDGSQSLIKEYQARYPDLIVAIFHRQNLGVAQTRIHALEAVKGEYVTYLDGDDRYLPAKLEKELALLRRHPRAQIAYSNSYYITPDGRRTKTWVTDQVPPQGDVFVQTLTRRFPRGNLFRMELLPYALWQAAGFHDPSLAVLEDWDMRIRLTSRYRVVYEQTALSEIRVHRDGLSNVETAVKLGALETIRQKYEPLLAAMSAAERSSVIKEMDRLHAVFLRRQAKETLGAYAHSRRGSKGEAWAYYADSWRYQRSLDWDLLSGLLLPAGLYLPFRRWARAVAGQGDGR